jgi:hypothetical protein
MPEDGNEAVAHMLSEAEQLLGITGPKYMITVDGHLYRLLPQPAEQPARAAALFAEMLYMVRHWLGEHPEATAEMSEYGVPVDDEIKAMPFAVQMAIFLGVSLEIYARQHGGNELEEHED